jgi:D-alanine-D-alanine ligase
MRKNLKRKLRVIVLVHEDLLPPDTLDGVENKAKAPWRTEYDVVSTLRVWGTKFGPSVSEAS